MRKEGVEVLADEVLAPVDDGAGVVLYDELLGVGPGPVGVLEVRRGAADAVEGMRLVGLVPLAHEVAVAGRSAARALALHEGYEAERLLLHELYALVVVRELRPVPLDLLPLVLHGLLLEDRQVEELLQLLVREVDEQLLEPVGRHLLEAEDVEDADELVAALGRYT